MTAVFIFVSVLPVSAESAELSYEQFCLLESCAKACDTIYGTVYSSSFVYNTVTNYLSDISPWKEQFTDYYSSVEIPAAEFEKTAREYFDYKTAGALDGELSSIRENTYTYNKASGCYIIVHTGIGDAPNTYLGYTRSGDEYSFWYGYTDYTDEGVVVNDYGKVYVLRYENGHQCYVDSYSFTAEDIPAKFDAAPSFSSPSFGDYDTLQTNGCAYDSVSFFSDEYFPEGTNVNIGFYTPAQAADFPEYTLTGTENTAIYVSVVARSSAVEGEIQPKAPVTFEFRLPENCSHNVSFYYLEEGKKPVELPVSVDIFNGTFSVAFEHFSSYVMVFSEPLAGDIDGDKNISAADARLALRAAVGLEKFEKSSVAAAGDVNHNGTIAADDARLILRASVGLEKL